MRLIVAALALALATSAFAQSETRFAVSAYHVEGDNPLSDADTRQLLQPFVGPQIGLDELQDAATALESAFKARGFAFLRVVLPPQDTGGTVTLRVLAFRLGDITVSGNQNFSTANVLASLPALRPGETPNLRELARNQALANEHPAKQVNVSLREGARPDTIDAQVAVRDASPLRLFGSLSNTGGAQTGDWRVSAGMQHANLFDRDHALSASYTTSPGHWSDVAQYGAFYSVPFYGLSGTATAFYSHSDVNSGTIANLFEVSGRGDFMGLRWKQHLLPVGAYSHQLEIGIEDRHFINNVSFAGTPIGSNLRSRPLALAYGMRYDYPGGQLRGSIERVQNLPGGRDNDDAAYVASRAGARRDWRAWHFSFDAQQAFGDWTGALRVRGQVAREPLASGEQFGFGGASSVRGLREREVTGDLGYYASIEATSPEFFGMLRAVAFLEGGEVRVRSPAPGQAARLDAASIGAGLRWIVAPGVAASFDLARVVNGAASSDDGESRLHVLITFQF